MKQLNKIILSLVVFMACLFVNTNNTLAEETLDCSIILKNGSNGTQVKILQNELNEVMACGLTADGAFGAKTKTCVVNFQKKNSLTQDGIVGANTCKKLNTTYLASINTKVEEEEDKTETEDKITESIPVDNMDCSGSLLKSGSSGTQVKILQKQLNATMGSNLTEDGSFGAQTKTWVQKFQKNTNLSADGIVGTGTCKKLNQVYNNRYDANITKQGNETTLNVRSKLSLNSSGTQVKLLQTELNKVISCGLTADGAFGAKTKTCVQSFQTKYGLTADGIVGFDTVGMLNKEYLKSNTYVVSNSALVIRSATSTTSSEIATAIYGTVFKVYGTTTANNITWYKIKYNNAYAYINSASTTKNAVVVDISAQTLKLYNNGKLTIDTPVITGTKGQHDTPTGSFNLTYKVRDLTLTKYNAFVNYWMPFNGDIGFHDADGWRTTDQFLEANRYTWNGSHGCINMLDNAAKTLYSYINSKTNIFVVE